MAKDDTPAADAADDKATGTPLEVGDLNEWGNDVSISEGKLFNERGQNVRQKEELDKEEEQAEDEVDADTSADTDTEDEELDDTPTPQATLVDDPGEFTPRDYSFEVTTYDGEGKNGRVTKVRSIDEWDKLLEGEPNFGSAVSLLKAQRQATKMENGTERDQAEWETKKEAYDKNQEEVQAREESLNDIENGMAYLEEKGFVKKVPVKYRGDWDSTEAKKDPAIKEQQALIKFWEKENTIRSKAGLKPIANILDAYNAWEVEKRRQGDEEDKKTQGQIRREAGARVAGSSPGVMPNVPKGIAVGRAGNLSDIGLGW